MGATPIGPGAPAGRGYAAGCGSRMVWPLTIAFGSVISGFAARTASSVRPNLRAIDASRSPGWTVYSEQSGSASHGGSRANRSRLKMSVPSQ